MPCPYQSCVPNDANGYIFLTLLQTFLYPRTIFRIALPKVFHHALLNIGVTICNSKDGKMKCDRTFPPLQR